MKDLLAVHKIIFCVFFICITCSCDHNSERGSNNEQPRYNNSDNNFTNVPPPPLPDTTPSEAVLAKAKQEKIDLELKEERKTSRIQKAQRFVDNLTEEYMKKLAPQSGEKPNCLLRLDSYNNETETIKLTAISSFYACVRGTTCNEKEYHEFVGYLTIMGNDGSLDYYIDFKNPAIKESEEYNKFWNDVGDWVIKKVIEENKKEK